jgi:hypothetical protein
MGIVVSLISMVFRVMFLLLRSVVTLFFMIFRAVAR